MSVALLVRGTKGAPLDCWLLYCGLRLAATKDHCLWGSLPIANKRDIDTGSGAVFHGPDASCRRVV